jgi:hypothetical protein
MDNKITFDLKLLEFALNKAIEILTYESVLVSTRLNVKAEELEKISSEKEDIMNFIDWHIPLIVRYIKMHKEDNDLSDISQLALKADIINKNVQEELHKKVKPPQQQSIGQQKISTITLVSNEKEEKPLIDVIFVNDSDSMPKTITKLLKELVAELESNINKLSVRKKLNEQIFNIVTETIKSDNKVSYSPKRKKENIEGNFIYKEDC